MTNEEYEVMERQIPDAIWRLKSAGIDNDSIAIIMSQDVYEMAGGRGGNILTVGMCDLRVTYWGCDVYIVDQAGYSIFSPAIKRFPTDSEINLDLIGTGHFVISESGSNDGAFLVYMKDQDSQSIFRDAGFTVRRPKQILFADRPWRRPYRTIPNDWLSSDNYYRADYVCAFAMQEPDEINAKKKKDPQVKDWDERITPDDTKELDEFLGSLMRNGALEPAT